MTPADIDEAGGRKRALGRGLNALFGDDEAEMAVSGSALSTENLSEPPASSGRRLISVGQLVPGAFQPRHVFNDDSLDELATSISQHGLLQPILVRPHPSLPDNFEIVAGERRWRAAQKAQLHEVPVVIRELDDTATLEIALIENLQREDLNAVDEARALKQLVDQFDYTAEQVAEKLGKSRSYVANMLRLTELSEPVLSLVAEGKLSAGHARALIPLVRDQQIEEAKKIIALGLNVRQTEKMVSELQGRDIKHRTDKIARKIAAGEAQDKDLNTLALEREVSNILGMRVSIDMVSAQEGQMTIAFKSLDQLDEVLHRLSHNPGRLAIKG
ncbi:MAG: ParB/RepB/Spo0J family partition protein [Pseudobdellovibrionaceae bacterium]